MLAAVAVGLVLRLAHLLFIYNADPLLLDPVIDAAAYHEWAVRLLDDPVGDSVFFQSPGYPYAVAAIYAVFGASWVAVGALQGVLGAASAWLAALVTRQIAPRARWAPAVAAWLMALYAPLIFYDAVLLKVELTNFSLLAFVWVFSRGLKSWRWMLAAGVGMGLLGLLRGNVYFALPMLIVWIPLVGRRFAGALRDADDGVETPPEPWATLGVRTGAFLAGFALMLVLVGVRNYVVADQFVMSSAGGGGTLYIGNNPYNPLGDYNHMPFVRANPAFEEEDFRAEASRRAGRALTTAEASTFWRDEAVSYSLDNPGTTLRRGIHRAGLVMQSYELGDNYSLKFHGEFSPVVWPPIPWWTIVLALALGWVVCSRRGGARAGPLVIMGIGYLATLLIFFVRSRYRIPMVPLLIPLAAIEAVTLVELLRTQRRRAAIHAAVIGLAAAISLALGVPKTVSENLGPWWSALGGRHIEAGNVEKGLALMQKGAAMDPNNAVVWMNLGRVYLGTDQNERAEDACARAIKLDKVRDDARECLAVARIELGDPEGAWVALKPAIRPRMPVNRYVLAALTAEASGREDEAVNLLRQGIAEHGTEVGFEQLITRIRQVPPE